MNLILNDLLSFQGDMSWQSILTNLVMAILIGVILYFTHAAVRSRDAVSASAPFRISLIVLIILISTIITVIGNNLITSGALIISVLILLLAVRIRNFIDAVFVIWAVVEGVACGYGDYVVAAICAAVICLLLVFLRRLLSGKTVYITVRGTNGIENNVHSFVFKYFNRKAVLLAKNSGEHSVELVYEIKEKHVKKAFSQYPGLTDAFYALGNIEHISFTADTRSEQTSEILSGNIKT